MARFYKASFSVDPWQQLLQRSGAGQRPPAPNAAAPPGPPGAQGQSGQVGQEHAGGAGEEEGRLEERDEPPSDGVDTP